MKNPLRTRSRSITNAADTTPSTAPTACIWQVPAFSNGSHAETFRWMLSIGYELVMIYVGTQMRTHPP